MKTLVEFKTLEMDSLYKLNGGYSGSSCSTSSTGKGSGSSITNGYGFGSTSLPDWIVKAREYSRKKDYALVAKADSAPTTKSTSQIISAMYVDYRSVDPVAWGSKGYSTVIYVNV